MKKLILSSSQFTGEVHIVYDADLRLMMIDMSGSELSDEQIVVMKSRVPVVFNQDTFFQAFGSKTLNVIEADFKVSFEEFWNKYNLKRNKERVLKIWEKLKESEKVKAFYSLGQYDRHLQLNTWKTKADPDTYLRNKYFNNEWK
jgi:hypothetical protein